MELFVRSVIFFSAFSCFVLFELTFLFKFVTLSRKSVFYKIDIAIIFASYICSNLEAKFSDINFLNSCVLIYLLLHYFLCYSQF